MTGGALRIGRAITERLQAEGVEVVVHYRKSRAAAEALSEYTVQGNLEHPEACAELLETVESVDILVNNASIFSQDTLRKASSEKVLREFQVNLFAPLALMRSFAARTKKGAVVNLLDRRIQSNDTSGVPYLLTKKGLADLTRLAAMEFAPEIRVNGVAPGPVLPPPGCDTNDLFERAGTLPLGKLPIPSQIADAVVFLLQADSVTGQVIYVDAGQHLLGNAV